jgi:hypothetical protein
MATATMCDPCHSRNIINASVSWCMECEEELCSECAVHHKAMKVAKNHQCNWFKAKNIIFSAVEQA